MNERAIENIHGYLDDVLTKEQHEELAQWICADGENACQFAAMVSLHDALRNQFAAPTHDGDSLLPESKVSAAAVAGSRQIRWPRSVLAAVTTAALLLGGAILVWQGLGLTQVSAAVVELDRIIEANIHSKDRSYLITVEDVASPSVRDKQSSRAEQGRPPKPPLDGARLDVRAGRQFVLVRQTKNGLPFITGSNGVTSWAVRPDGPVRVSSDLTRFSRDLPGHEHAIPLSNMQDGLTHVRAAYDVRLLPPENQSSNARELGQPTRTLVADRRPGNRGPNRVEISYEPVSGQILQMRFIEMPYGPERLTLRMTFVEEKNLPSDYFDHKVHHEAGRVVEFEE